MLLLLSPYSRLHFDHRAQTPRRGTDNITDTPLMQWWHLYIMYYDV